MGTVPTLTTHAPLVNHVAIVENVALREGVGGDDGSGARGGDAQVVHGLGAEELPDGGPQHLAPCLFLFYLFHCCDDVNWVRGSSFREGTRPPCAGVRTVGPAGVGGGARALELDLPALALAVDHLPQGDGRAVAELNLWERRGGLSGWGVYTYRACFCVCVPTWPLKAPNWWPQ